MNKFIRGLALFTAVCLVAMIVTLGILFIVTVKELLGPTIGSITALAVVVFVACMVVSFMED